MAKPLELITTTDENINFRIPSPSSSMPHVNNSNGITCFTSGLTDDSGGASLTNRINRCNSCDERAIGFGCGNLFCEKHRYPEEDECFVDLKAIDRQALVKEIPECKGNVDGASLTTAANASASENAILDPNSPYCLYPSDDYGYEPGWVLVTQPLEERGENYFPWRWRFLIALRSMRKAGFVDGTIRKPDAGSRELQPWIQCNAMVSSWLMNALSKQLQRQVSHTGTASEIWADLEERFTKPVALRVYERRTAIRLLQQENATVSTYSVPIYYGRLRCLWKEIEALDPKPICGECSCGAANQIQEMMERDKIFDFLMGLNEEFSTVRSLILNMEPLPSLSRTYAIIAQEERVQAIVAAARTEGQPGTHGRNRGGEKPRCSHCNKLGHSREGCFELIGYPSNWGNRTNQR